jgi:hypothetical protein
LRPGADAQLRLRWRTAAQNFVEEEKRVQRSFGFTSGFDN